MGLKHKLKRLSKQFEVSSVQMRASVEGIAQVRRIVEQQNQATQQQTILLEKLTQKIDRLLEQNPKAPEPETNNLLAVAEQYTAVARYQSELVRLQAENISRLLTLIDRQDQDKG